MGGDGTTFSHDSSSSGEDDGSSLDQEFPEQTFHNPKFRQVIFGTKVEIDSTKADIDLNFGKSEETGCGISYNSLSLKAADQRRARNIYKKVLASYDDLPCRIEGLEEAKTRILSYRPGSWIGKVGGLKPSDYHLPETTTILLIGPKGSGKSSLVNRISKVFEDDKFASERAQVSYHSTVGEGTHFLHEYMIPRASNAFCLYDTRSMSDDLFENMKLLKRWMTEGVRHGELVQRASDPADVESRKKCKVRQIDHSNGKIRMVNFVVMVVNGHSVLESMASGDAEKKRYTEIIAAAFNSPFLSFKDDKPAVVITHGDLLTISDRVRIRIYLGELLGIPPKAQIFDIPDCNDLTTEIAIVDLLRHCLEHADSNLPLKSRSMIKLYKTSLAAYLLVLGVVAISISFAFMHRACLHHSHERPAPPDIHINWHAIRHLWLDED